MEKEGSNLKSLLSFYSPNYTPDDPSMNVSVYSSGVSKGLSPYLNIDPYVTQEPEFILPEGAARQRGRFEYAFGTIGSGVMIGGTYGSVAGLYTGWKATKSLTGNVRRAQLINYVTKSGASTANALGVAAVMYSGMGCLLSYYRETEDDLNTVVAATATGLLYKSTAGLRRCAVGGAVGFVLAGAYCLWRQGGKDRSIADYIGTRHGSSY